MLMANKTANAKPALERFVIAFTSNESAEANWTELEFVRDPLPVERKNTSSPHSLKGRAGSSKCEPRDYANLRIETNRIPIAYFWRCFRSLPSAFHQARVYAESSPCLPRGPSCGQFLP